MAAHNLKIKDPFPIKDLCEFVSHNNIKQDDEIIVDNNTFKDLSYITRHLLFLIMRGCISNNRVYSWLLPLPECKIDTLNFHNNESFAQALFQETGVKITFRGRNVNIAYA